MKCRTSVEAEPSEPQDSGSEHRQRKRMGMHALSGPTLALAKDDDHGKCGCTGVDVNDGATGEIECAELGQPAAAEDPVGDGGVDHDQPHGDEDRVGLELHPVRCCAGDERRCDHREGHLISAEEDERDRETEPFRPGAHIDLPHPGEIEVADPSAIAGVSERQGEADEHPHDCEQAHGEEVLHEHAENVLGSDHACIEKGKTRSHEQNESCRHEHPGGITGIDH
ncbi:unannotated protein [freshwater metagenome]|uniref:Unannotated protein n=1 Tax=freshwater metagenome TaxID=449393 RepID=A0A6J6INZ7_9ZZZZ